jgi:TonB family protein
MKTKVVAILFMALSDVAFGKSGKSSRMPETELNLASPRFPAEAIILEGKKINSINDYLGCNIQYPEEALNNSVQGTALIHFLINPEGEVTSVNVVNSVSPEIDNEMLRLLKATSGNWAPAKVNGVPIAKEKEIAVVFKLDETKDFLSMARSYAKIGNKKLFIKGEPKKAMKYYDMAINLLPKDDCLLTMRGLCKLQLGDKEGALNDWSRTQNGSTLTIDQLASGSFGDDDVGKFQEYSEIGPSGK